MTVHVDVCNCMWEWHGSIPSDLAEEPLSRCGEPLGVVRYPGLGAPPVHDSSTKGCRNLSIRANSVNLFCDCKNRKRDDVAVHWQRRDGDRRARTAESWGLLSVQKFKGPNYSTHDRIYQPIARARYPSLRAQSTSILLRLTSLSTPFQPKLRYIYEQIY